MENQEFSSELILLRIKKGLSQQELATLSSYTQTYISLIETDKANPSERCKKALLEVLEDK